MTASPKAEPAIAITAPWTKTHAPNRAERAPQSLVPFISLSPLRPLSPFRWYLQPDPLVGGIAAINVAVLAGITVLAYAAALIAFEQRDLRA